MIQNGLFRTEDFVQVENQYGASICLRNLIFSFCVLSKTWKSIWNSYLLSKLALFRHGSRDVANFAKPLLNIRVEEAFLTPLDRKAQFCAPKRLPKALCFIVFAYSSQPWGALGEKASMWKANSRSISISRFFAKLQNEKSFTKVNRRSILIFHKEKIAPKKIHVEGK